MGDTIQFARYVPMLAQRGAKVILFCPLQLKDLLKTVPGITGVVTEKDPKPQYDSWLPMASLPHVFGTTLETIPREVPYVFPPEERLDAFRFRLQADPGFKVGIVWAGSSTHQNDRARSVKLVDFLALAQIERLRLYSLQKGDASRQLAKAPRDLHVTDLSEMIRSFLDTAAAAQNLDLIISVDTSVVHVAGAMGRPVWTLLPFGADWRWLTERSDSPWYPTMRLFRQPRLGDWQSVFEEVAMALKEKVRGAK
jgi:ADP-heptose:LPS heptosyltransferase